MLRIHNIVKKSRIHLEGTHNSTKSAQHCHEFNRVSILDKKFLHGCGIQGFEPTTMKHIHTHVQA